MNRLLILLIASSILFSACKNNTTTKPQKAATADTATRFPVVELFLNDMDEVKKIPYYIYKITTRPGDKKYKDSVAVSPKEFAQIIAPLQAIKIEKEKYQEDAFHDLSTASFSIITKALDVNTEVASVTTLLNDETKKLKSIFIIINKNEGDSKVHTNYFWKAGKSLTIAKEISFKNGTIQAETQFINWNDKD
jgi:hypothetical protein